jgi:enoyl-[acyl-carrier protein] reductase/trans-2-enoyl-CoA reductase (NAD+)
VLLMRVMKKKNIHEDCIHQIVRLFHDRLYNGRSLNEIPTDPQGRVRVDDWEMRQDVQDEVSALWKNVVTTNVNDIADVKGYEEDFLKLFGFGLKGVDYNADVEVDLSME